MPHPITEHLNEQLRDAMLAFYLTSVLPEDPTVQSLNLTNTFKTDDDVYTYWLLDPQVSQAVPTTRIASAIASLQLYINGIYLGLEAGYEHKGMSAAQQTNWRDNLLNYSLWRANQQLRHYPASYLSPTLRHDKSDSFKQLENELSHFQIQPGPLLAAVHSYLNRFEELATIKTLNGYIDGDKNNLAESIYYLIGKSSSDNTYYWRSLDMSQRPAADHLSKKSDVPSPEAWSGWKKIHLSIDENVPEQTIRPVLFNGRLFVVWAQCINPAAASSSRDVTAFRGRGEDESIKDFQQRFEARLKSNHLQFRLYFSYKKLDDNWSTPQVCIQEYSLAKDLDELSSEELMKATASIAVLDSKTQPPSLFLGLSAQPNNQPPGLSNGTSRHFYQAVRLDQHFNIHSLETIGSPRNLWQWLKEPELAGRYLTLFTHHNKTNFQFRAPESVHVKLEKLSAEPDLSTPSTWNFDGLSKKILDLPKDSDIELNLTTSVLEVTARLAERFEPHRTVSFKYAGTLVGLSVTLSTNDASLSNGLLKLNGDSRIIIKTDQLADLSAVELKLAITCDKTGVSRSGFILDAHSKPFKLALSRAKAGEKSPTEATLSLESAHIAWEAFDDFINSLNDTYTIALSFYDTAGTEHAHMRDLFLGPARLSQKQRLYKPVLMYPKQAKAAPPENPHRNNTVLVGLADTSRRNLRDAFTELPSTHTFAVQIELNPKTLRPWGEDVDKEKTDKLTLIHGVLILESDVRYPDANILGYALKTATFKLDPLHSNTIIPLAPGIRRFTSAPYGTAEFIDFSGSLIENSDTPGTKRAPIRTNTHMASLLTKTASTDLHDVFAVPMDDWREPPLVAKQSSNPLDFQGAYGGYFWELFLYLPWLLAHRLNQEQQYAEAERWLRYLFDPAANAGPSSQPSTYWRLPVLLTDKPHVNTALASPHQLAISTPVHFRQAIYLLYVDLLLNRGDTAYRQMTRDSLAEAKLWYIRAKGLLGPRPPFNPIDPWATTTLEQLQLPASGPAVTTGSSRLCKSLSPDLLLRWDKIEGRLYNLRHHLDLTGKPLTLPLYAATLTPQGLLAAYQQGAGADSARAALRTAQAGHYRFQVILGHALQAVDNLVQLGTTLLSLLERKEQAQYLQTQQQQAWDLARMAVEQQAQAVQYDVKNKEALQAGRAIVQGRVTFFEQQLKAGITPAEALASQEYQDSARWETAAAVAQAGAGLAMLIPNIFGTSNGGVRYEGAFHALQAAAQGIANDKRANAANLDRSEQFARRTAEWAHALEQARLELAQVDAQLQAFSQQEAQTRLQLRLAQTTHDQARTLHETLGKRFSNSQLYQWLNGQLSAFYFQAYDSTLSLCLAAQACWQEERAQWDKQFIQTHLWSNQYRGLTAGEALRQNLLAMSNAYITHNERLLEITKTLSLRQLHTKGPQATAGKTWAALKDELLKSGTLTFELTPELFEDDYPGHYLRRIKNVSISLPATLGPYEDIKAILTQTANTTVLAPSTPNTPAPVVKKDLRVRQEVALSSGLNDSGLFNLNFDNDERYLPFEYTGAISKWQLSFPNHTSQQAMLESLTDIIVHLRYTAKSSGGQR